MDGRPRCGGTDSLEVVLDPFILLCGAHGHDAVSTLAGGRLAKPSQGTADARDERFGISLQFVKDSGFFISFAPIGFTAAAAGISAEPSTPA